MTNLYISPKVEEKKGRKKDQGELGRNTERLLNRSLAAISLKGGIQSAQGKKM